MNFIKRAILSLGFHWKNTLITFAIFLVLSTLILCGLCVGEATDRAAAEAGERIGGTVTLLSTVMSDDTERLNNVIEAEVIRRVEEQPGVTEVKTEEGILAYPENFAAYYMGSQAEDFPDAPPLFVNALGALVDSPSFLSGDFNIVSGRFAPGGIMIHETLAKQNGLEIGDTVSLRGTGGTAEMAVTGIFSGVPFANSPAPYFNIENIVYIFAEDAPMLSDGAYFSGATISTSEPQNIDRLEAVIVGLLDNMYKGDGVTVTVDSEAYDSVAGIFRAMQAASTAMVYGSILLGAVILTLLSYLALRDRTYEIGVLLAMGEKKSCLVIQLVLEVLFPLLLSVSGAVALSAVFVSKLGALFGSAEMLVTMEPVPIALVYGFGAALILVASLPTMYKVACYKPKTIIMAME